MRALLDVNVLIALHDREHSLHAPALDWFAANAPTGWATCPMTQNGCMRIMASRSYGRPLPVQQIAHRLARTCAHSYHQFWADDISLLDAGIDVTRIHNPLQLTDIYLLALAIHHGGRLVTFDHAISLGAVHGAEPRHLLRL